MSIAWWIIIGFGGAFLTLYGGIAIYMAMTIWKEERAEKKRKKVKII